MKILALTNLYPPDFIGGYELVCWQVVDALRAAGHDVRVLTSAPRQPVPPVPHVDRMFKLGARFNSHSTSPMFVHLEEAESNFVNAHNVHILTTLLERFQPDVTCLWNLTGLGGLGLMACLHHLRVPWVWYLGDCVPANLCRNREIVVPALAREFERQVRGHYLVVSQQLIEEIRSLGIRLNGHVELVPGWIRGRRPEPRTDFYKGGQLRIVSAGYLSRHKGIDLIIEAAGRLRDEGYEDFAIDLYGNVSDSSFRNLIQVLKLEDRVALRGVRTQAELAALYGQYDVFAFPTWEREPFGLGPLEAAAYGSVPVITRRCGIAEWFVHGVHCLKAERTAEAFAGVFRDILDGKIDLEPIGRRASAVVWRDFHLDVFVPRIERALERAAQQPRSGAGTADEAYRMALLAEKLTQVVIQEAACA